MIGLSCQGACHRATVPEIILSEAHCQANRGINAVLYSNFISYLSFFSFGFCVSFLSVFSGRAHRAIEGIGMLGAVLRSELAEADAVVLDISPCLIP